MLKNQQQPRIHPMYLFLHCDHRRIMALQLQQNLFRIEQAAPARIATDECAQKLQKLIDELTAEKDAYATLQGATNQQSRSVRRKE